MIEQNAHSVNLLFLYKENSKGSRTHMAANGGAHLFAVGNQVACGNQLGFQGNAVFHAVGIDAVDWIVFVQGVFLYGV